MKHPEAWAVGRVPWQFFCTLTWANMRSFKRPPSPRRQVCAAFAFFREAAHVAGVHFKKSMWCLRYETGEMTGRDHYHCLLSVGSPAHQPPRPLPPPRWARSGSGSRRVSISWIFGRRSCAAVTPAEEEEGNVAVGGWASRPCICTRRGGGREQRGLEGGRAAWRRGLYVQRPRGGEQWRLAGGRISLHGEGSDFAVEDSADALGTESREMSMAQWGQSVFRFIDTRQMIPV